MGKDFYSIEYVDEDGDLVIRHGMMTNEEASKLIEGFRSRGIRASVNRLSGQQGADVSSLDVEKLLGRGDTGVDR